MIAYNLRKIKIIDRSMKKAKGANLVFFYGYISRVGKIALNNNYKNGVWCGEPITSKYARMLVAFTLRETKLG